MQFILVEKVSTAGVSIADTLFERHHFAEYTHTLSKIIQSIMMITVIIISSAMVIITKEGT